METNIFEILNETIEDNFIFENHLIRKLGLEEKLQYLQGLSLVMNADNEIDEDEKGYLSLLIKSFELDEGTLESCVSFAENPDKDAIQEFMQAFRQRPEAQVFLFDALMMTQPDNRIHGKGKVVLSQINGKVQGAFRTCRRWTVIQLFLFQVRKLTGLNRQGEEKTVVNNIAEYLKLSKKKMQTFLGTLWQLPVTRAFLTYGFRMIHLENRVLEKRIAVVNRLADLLEIPKSIQEDISQLFCHIKNRNLNESILFFNLESLNPEHYQHVLDYHGVELDALLAKTERLRSERILRAIAAKMSELDLDETRLFKPLLDHDLVIPMLQAEIDRGAATVQDGILTMVDKPEFKNLKLASAGIGWGQQHNKLISEKPQPINHSGVKKLFTKLLCNIPFIRMVEILTKGAIKYPVAKVCEDSIYKLELNHPLNSEFPLLDFAGEIYEYSHNEGSWDFIIESLEAEEPFERGVDNIHVVNRKWKYEGKLEKATTIDNKEFLDLLFDEGLTFSLRHKIQ